MFNVIWSVEYTNPNACRCWTFIIDLIWSDVKYMDISDVIKMADGHSQQYFKMETYEQEEDISNAISNMS